MRTIDFLDQLGRMPQMNQAEYEKAIVEAGVDETEARSLRGRDASKLSALLGGRAQVWCAIMAPDEAPAEDQPDSPVRDEPEPEQSGLA